MTNFEKIKNMNIDQLAEKLDESFACDRCPIGEFCDKLNLTYMSCTDAWINWLKSEVQKQ